MNKFESKLMTASAWMHSALIATVGLSIYMNGLESPGPLVTVYFSTYVIMLSLYLLLASGASGMHWFLKTVAEGLIMDAEHKLEKGDISDQEALEKINSARKYGRLKVTAGKPISTLERINLLAAFVVALVLVVHGSSTVMLMTYMILSYVAYAAPLVRISDVRRSGLAHNEYVIMECDSAERRIRDKMGKTHFGDIVPSLMMKGIRGQVEMMAKSFIDKIDTIGARINKVIITRGLVGDVDFSQYEVELLDVEDGESICVEYYYRSNPDEMKRMLVLVCENA